jgi:hypothetical protein
MPRPVGEPGGRGAESEARRRGRKPPRPAVTTPRSATTPAGARRYAADQTVRTVRPQPRPAPSLSQPSPISPLLDTLNDLLSPDPNRRSLVSESVLQPLTDLARNAGREVRKGAEAAVELPSKRVDAAFGRPTLGVPQLRQVVQAARNDQLGVNQNGKLTIPATRRAARDLKEAKQEAARSGGGIEGITHGPQATRFANTLTRLTGIHPKAVGAWVQAEGGGWGGSGVSGGEAGKNNWLGVGYPGHQTPFARSPHFNTTPERAAKATAEWMEGKLGDEYDYGAAPSIETILPRSKGKGPQAFLQALADSGWGTTVEHVAQNLSMIRNRPADPEAVQKLQAAKQEARRLGIPTSPDLEQGPRPDVVYVRADAKGMTEWAEAAVGTAEGSAKQANWSAITGGVTDPWCAVFINAGLKRRGIELPPNVSHSESFLDPAWKGGTQLGTTDLRKAKPGDILVFDWGDGGETDHTALYIGNGEMVGGNESDAVQQNTVPAESIVGIARPHYKGGKVAVDASAPLPSYSPSAGLVSAPAGATAPGGATGLLQQQRAPVAASPIPISELLKTLSLNPDEVAAEGEEAREGDGTIARLLARKRL